MLQCIFSTLELSSNLRKQQNVNEEGEKEISKRNQTTIK